MKTRLSAPTTKKKPTTTDLIRLVSDAGSTKGPGCNVLNVHVVRGDFTKPTFPCGWSLKRIANAAKISKSGVKRGIKTLERDHLIDVEHRYDTSNVYHINIALLQQQAGEAKKSRSKQGAYRPSFGLPQDVPQDNFDEDVDESFPDDLVGDKPATASAAPATSAETTSLRAEAKKPAAGDKKPAGAKRAGNQVTGDQIEQIVEALNECEEIKERVDASDVRDIASDLLRDHGFDLVEYITSPVPYRILKSVAGAESRPGGRLRVCLNNEVRYRLEVESCNPLDGFLDREIKQILKYVTGDRVQIFGFSAKEVERYANQEYRERYRQRVINLSGGDFVVGEYYTADDGGEMFDVKKWQEGDGDDEEESGRSDHADWEEKWDDEINQTLDSVDCDSPKDLSFPDKDEETLAKYRDQMILQAGDAYEIGPIREGADGVLRFTVKIDWNPTTIDDDEGGDGDEDPEEDAGELHNSVLPGRSMLAPTPAAAPEATPVPAVPAPVTVAAVSAAPEAVKPSSAPPEPAPSAATPVFSPVAGTYNSGQKVELTVSTPNATIYYTTDGRTPSPGSTKSVQYTAAFTVSVRATLKAIAVAPGFSRSAVATADYIITPPPPVPEKFIHLHKDLIEVKQFDLRHTRGWSPESRTGQRNTSAIARTRRSASSRS